MIEDSKYTPKNLEEPVFQKQSSMNDESKSKEDIGKKISHRLNIANKVKEISKGDWLLNQEILQDIQAELLSRNPEGKMPSASKLLEMLKAEIELRYNSEEKEEKEIRELLLESLPTTRRLNQWLEIENWQETVWGKIRSCHLFNKENRYKVIDTLMGKALKGDTMAAKIWLTLSGDYSEKMDINTDKRLEAYREINEILHKKAVDKDT